MKIGGNGKEVEVDETFIGGAHASCIAKTPSPHYRDWRQRQDCRDRYPRTWRRCTRHCHSDSPQASFQGEVLATSNRGTASTPMRSCPIRVLDIQGLRAQGNRPCREVRRWAGSHQRTRKLLEFAQAWTQGNLCERRTVPPVPLSGRTSVPLQQSRQRSPMNDGDRFEHVLLMFSVSASPMPK